ncbi:glycosyltransferase family 2 protein [Streptococcus pantholopis]|uniref:Alpha-L-Rha alpha-1,3-L-rhamnosyltransferase n=1 Tax=Streptococcus pantholopis TaxID=1811193 RepID=A0A172Q6Q9_9STRE|nr:glycosyltransferase family 2 protein [Streptococcus pantholopis]AND79148.1 alpha-L-Rha alpha-1,3-L-rhamnosyltransferase [Streptococcus pantholopis]
MKVNILMSTYNGESFVAEQIESIQAQTFKNWQLLIRDDGSSDRTPNIIEQYVKKDRRIRFINADKRENIGVIQNFFTLVKYEKADYYFFSDQDDIWLQDKLEMTLKEAAKYEKNSPLVVYTDLKIVDRNLTVLQESMIKTQSGHANTDLLAELTENTVTGGTMLINHALAEQWHHCRSLLMHDWYLALLASALGRLVYLDRATELYRQHDSNVLGARTWSKRMKNWLRPHKLLEKYWLLITASQKQAENLLDLDLSDDTRDLVEAYVSLLDKPLSQRLELLRICGFRKNRPFHTFVFRTLIVTKFGYRRK